MILSLQNIAKSYGVKTVLKKINFHIEEKEKVAIVGINGAGKTTLLRIITGEESADSGNVVISKDVRIGYLSQNQDVSFSNTIYEEMLVTKKYLIEMNDRMRELEQLMKHAEGEELDKLLEEYNVLSTKYDRENGYAYKSEITGVLKGLGFTEKDYDRHISTLSGGQKMRIALGRLLLSKPEILMLDEPTNHLDMDSVAWLEDFLASYSGAVIVVSHDRYFIDRVSTKIVEIDAGVSTVFNGNYSFYASERAAIRAAKMHAYMNQQQEIKHQEEVITKLKQFNREKSIKRAESREKQLAKVERLEKPSEYKAEMRLTLTPSNLSGEDVLSVTELSKSFGELSLFKDLNIDIKRGEHVALIGGNGTGKTTILKLIDHRLTKDSGHITLGSRVKIGYFDQEHHDLSPEKTIFDEMSDSFPDLNNTRIRNVLAAFLFTGEDVFKQIKDLSGGERGRVSLAKLMLSPANFLILDEPTNHLDIQSKEILEDALSSYEGTLLFVSHDRYFINKVATRILNLSNKVLTNYAGDYDHYLQHKDEYFRLQHPEFFGATGSSQTGGPRNGSAIQSVSNVSNGSAQPGSIGSANSAQPYAASQNPAPAAGSKEDFLRFKAEQAAMKKRENDIKKLEEKISAAEEKLAEIDERFMDPSIASNAGALADLSKEREALEASLQEMYETWETLSE